jgi:tetratricopeptide (TPR) repeat protein
MNPFASQRLSGARMILVTILCLVPATFAKAQMAPTPQPEKVSNRVLQLVGEGKLTEADQVLQEALAECRQPAAPPNCSSMLTFTQAYLAQQEGAAGVEQARELYSKIISADPSNGPALNNLALVEDSAGNTKKAEELWSRAIAQDPDRAQHYALLLGDHYLRLKKMDDAVKAYDLAERSAPTAAAPRRRILSAYRQTEGISNLDALETRAKEWEQLDAADARAAYEFLVSRWASDGASRSRADDLLVQWGRLLARNDWLSAEAVSFLDPGQTQAARELVRYVHSPDERPGWDWWRKTPERYGATFEFARAMGRHELNADHDGAGRAVSCFEWALRLADPEALALSADVSNGYLRVSQELASVYFDHPELDPGAHRLSEMLERLYEGKMRAIDRGDRKVTQAYHTTLAYIYVSEGVWSAKPGTPPYMSAWYQLQAVLDDAAFRERREQYFQPLPEIKEMLTKALIEKGDKPGAARMSLLAALAYLDSDAIPESEQSLTRGISLGATGPEIPQLEKIISIRKASGKLALKEISSEKLPWLFEPSGSLTDAFLKRQRFKIYGDLLNATKDEPQQLATALEAYRLVVDEQTSLVGAGDLLRWERTEAAILRSTNVQPGRPIVAGNDSNVIVAPRTKLPIVLAGEDKPSTVAVQQETPAAVTILRTVGVANIHKLQPYIHFGQGQLILGPAIGNADADQLLRQLRSDPALRALIKPDVAPA